MKGMALFFTLAIVAAASTAGQIADEAQAEWEQVKRTTLIWTCTCVGGRSVYSYKTIQEMEDESNARAARERELVEKLSQPIQLAPGFILYPRKDPAAIKALAYKLANACK
jgi:hypothetical protein